MTEEDQHAVERLAVTTGMFALGDWDKPNLTALEKGHFWIVAIDDSGQVVGAAYFAPEPVADRLWNTFFLVVSKDLHGKGIGRFIMTHVEDLARIEKIRILIVETSSLESFSQARGFYQSLGYVREAEIRDFYAPGDNKVIFWKSLA